MHAREHWVVTGAGSGIGQGLVRLVRARGGCATACHEDSATCASTSDSDLVFDVRDEAAIVLAASQSTRPVDVLVACAGVFGPIESALELDCQRALDVYAINTLGPLRTVRAFLPRLQASARPRVALISSSLASTESKNTSDMAYSASKTALNCVARSLARELRADGIAVVAVDPGWVRTRIGGAEGELSVEESASGIARVLDTLSIEATGRFVRHDGTERPW